MLSHSKDRFVDGGKVMLSQDSAAQVICGLKLLWEDCVYGDEPDFEAGTRIDLYMMAEGIWEEIDFSDFCYDIERFFEFSCPREEWFAFFRFDIANQDPEEWKSSIAPELTFGALARFVAERVPVIPSFQPMKILGVSCESAGVFLGIQKVANEAAGRKLRFAPSARISDVLKGKRLRKFWEKLYWVTETTSPHLPTSQFDFTCMTGLIAMIGIVLTKWTTDPSWLVGSLSIILCFFAIEIVEKNEFRQVPKEIVTFRDLSMWIVNHRA